MSSRTDLERERRQREFRQAKAAAQNVLAGQFPWQIQPKDHGDEYPVAPTIVTPAGAQTELVRGASRLQAAAVRIAASLAKSIDLRLFIEPDPNADPEDVKERQRKELANIANVSVAIADYVLGTARHVEDTRREQAAEMAKKKAEQDVANDVARQNGEAGGIVLAAN